MKAILPIAFAILCVAIGHSAHQSAKATINEYQERQAETLCKLDLNACQLSI